MKVSIFGLGYVGAVTAACLAEQGHQIIGIDIHPQKVEDFSLGHTAIVEPGLDELLRQAWRNGLLRGTLTSDEAVAGSDVSLVCVGTPSRHDGAMDLTHVSEVTRQIAAELGHRKKRHVVIYRSTMLPGSTEKLAQEFLSAFLRHGSLDVLYYPEFLRESTAIADFREPSLLVVGTQNAKPLHPDLALLFGRDAPVIDWATAELLKYACNAFHATKVAFANEIGRIGKHMKIDAQLLMKLLCQDTRLNLSPYYLRPGNPFGGSCLPKDVRALGHFARERGLSLPLIENLLVSNQQHLQTLLSLIAERGKEVVILGLSFKAGTDDLRGSAMVEVAQSLLGHGFVIRIYDPQLNLKRLVGSNRRVIDLKMPHLASVLHQDLASAIGQKGLILAAQQCVSIAELRKHVTAAHHIMDINGWPELRSLPSTYEGFCWE
ncbi:MAG: nucleotide sugar dehydrogenase [Verrucomicrobia subdivision 3 bacterium]|nr:nucleotide sugar dehydrogenase [Limisphaerales bacterium]